MIKETVYSTLANDGTVAGLVGTRIYPVHLPQAATLPAIAHTVLGGTRDASLDGASGSGTFRVRVDAWAATSDAAWTLFRAARAALDALAGALAIINPVEFYDDEGLAYRVTIDYYIHHTEA